MTLPSLMPDEGTAWLDIAVQTIEVIEGNLVFIHEGTSC
jgi:hypothetical protein